MKNILKWLLTTATIVIGISGHIMLHESKHWATYILVHAMALLVTIPSIKYLSVFYAKKLKIK